MGNVNILQAWPHQLVLVKNKIYLLLQILDPNKHMPLQDFRKVLYTGTSCMCALVKKDWMQGVLTVKENLGFDFCQTGQKLPSMPPLIIVSMTSIIMTLKCNVYNVTPDLGKGV